MKRLAFAFILVPAMAFAQSLPTKYAEICTSPCTAGVDDNDNPVQQPAGYVANIIEWDGVTPFSPPAGYELKPDSDGSMQIGQTVTP
jgi:hypothetical protein